MSRRIATDTDLAIGTIVYKSAKAPTAWIVTGIATIVAPAHLDYGKKLYAVSKASTAKKSNVWAAHPAQSLYVEA